jgi:ADP-heptose:LPS heptosyltransferase
MEEMDLIISSDTATAHIAGSLGLPTWVVLHSDAFWVYRHSGDTTPWYPTMRLFRQQEALKWDEVMGRVRVELERKVAAHG